MKPINCRTPKTKARTATELQTAAEKPASNPPMVPPSLALFDKLPNAARVRVPVVAALHGISVATAWRWAREGRLPAPVRRGNVTTWSVGALRTWWRQ